MPKTFYTERDIEDLFARGVISLIVDDDVVLTDLARDKAMRLGLELVRENDRPPAAPERPYLAKLTSPSANAESSAGTGSAGAVKSANTSVTRSGGDELHRRVHDAVLARLGSSVDPNLLDTIIKRVLQNVSTK